MEEEFEFKPLTEGLGFHKKADQLKTEIRSTLASNSQTSAMQSTPTRSSIFPEIKSSPKSEVRADRMATKSFASDSFMTDPAPVGLSQSPTRASGETTRSASQSISELMASLPPSLDFFDDKQDLTRKSERPQIYQPLASSVGSSVSAPTISSGATVGSVLPAPGTKAGSPQVAAFAAPLAAPLGAPAIAGLGNSKSKNSRADYRARMTETFANTFPGADVSTHLGTEAEGLTPVTTNFSAGLIDAMVVAGISTILLVCVITITHINLVALLTNASTDSQTQKNLVFLFLAVLQMYMLVSRAFFGASLGEWAFELQLGTEAQQKRITYPVQVLWRMLMITFTGVLPLPLLSFAFRRDLSRFVSGLQLFRRA